MMQVEISEQKSTIDRTMNTSPHRIAPSVGASMAEGSGIPIDRVADQTAVLLDEDELYAQLQFGRD